VKEIPIILFGNRRKLWWLILEQLGRKAGHFKSPGNSKSIV